MPGVGLGSSAASAAAVACGLNHMFKLQLDGQSWCVWQPKAKQLLPDTLTQTTFQRPFMEAS